MLHEPRPHLLMLAAAAAAVFIGDMRLVEIRIGHNGNTFTWSEAALILGVSLTGWSWFILFGIPRYVLRQLLVGRSLLKTTFNAAAFATGSVAAQLGFILVSGAQRHLGSRSEPAPGHRLGSRGGHLQLVGQLRGVDRRGWSQKLTIRAVRQRGGSSAS